MSNSDAVMQRGLWIASKMSDLPEIYRESMPLESDPDKLMAAEQAIREQIRKDMKIHAPFHAGYLAVNPGGSLVGPMSTNVRAQMGAAQAKADLKEQGKANDPPPPPDLRKMSTDQKLMMGLKHSQTGTAKSPVTTQTRQQQAQSTSVNGFHQGNTGMSVNQKILLGLSQSTPARGRR